MSPVQLSICIPTYERPDYLKRLLDALAAQTFKAFEVIITDDSKTDSIKDFVATCHTTFPLLYYKNTPSLGTARNMVEGRKYASSDWIKIILDDDFPASDNALASYMSETGSGARFIFSGYNYFWEDADKIEDQTISQRRFGEICKAPGLLLANNDIGAPSVMMFRKDVDYFFADHMKWFTDVEYYMRIVEREKAVYIDRALINISINSTQITNHAKKNSGIVIPELIYVLEKHGSGMAKNIVVYDACWRLMRNHNIRSAEALKELVGEGAYTPPDFLLVVAKHLSRLPLFMLRIGALSKLFMSASYLLNRSNLG